MIPKLIQKKMIIFNACLGGVAGAGVAVSLVQGLYLSTVAFALLMVTNLTWPLLYRRAFFHGGMQGRAVMIESMPQAMERGMSPLDWITAEMERDGFTVVAVVDEDAEGPEEQ